MIEFPDLHSGELDSAGVRALVADLEAFAERLLVVPKAASKRFVLREALSLRAATDALLAGDLRGVQLRYVHDGQEWWDTLLAHASGFRIVRVAHGAA